MTQGQTRVDLEQPTGGGRYGMRDATAFENQEAPRRSVTRGWDARILPEGQPSPGDPSGSPKLGR